jgi:outer membrane biosynthesis protein TonB
MYPSIIYSIILHTVIIALVYFGLPHLFNKSDPQESVMTIDLLPIKDISNIQTKNTIQPKKDKPDEAKTIVKASGDIPEEKAEKPKEQPKEPPSPPTPKEKAEPAPIKKEEVKKEEIKKEEPKKEEVKKKKEKPKPKQNSEEDAWLKSMEDKADKKTEKATKNDTSSPEQDVADKKSKGNNFDPTKELSMSERDNIKTQIEDVWQYPAGAKDSDEMTVKLKIVIEKDGSVTSIKHIGGNSAGNETVYTIVVESAIRAVNMASPLQNLNPNNYHIWHELEMNFDIRHLLNKQ